MKNQLKKVAIGVDITCLANENSGSETNVQGAVVVNGSANVINGEREILINTNESTFIPAAHKHRLTNPDTAPS